MNAKIEKFILKNRVLCELPDETGAPTCFREATRILELRGRRGVMYTVAACPECAQYVRKHESTRRVG